MNLKNLTQDHLKKKIDAVNKKNNLKEVLIQ